MTEQAKRYITERSEQFEESMVYRISISDLISRLSATMDSERAYYQNRLKDAEAKITELELLSIADNSALVISASKADALATELGELQAENGVMYVLLVHVVALLERASAKGPVATRDEYAGIVEFLNKNLGEKQVANILEDEGNG